MSDEEAATQLVTADVTSSQEGEWLALQREARGGRIAVLGKVSFAIGLVVALAGTAHIASVRLFGDSRAVTAEVRGVLELRGVVTPAETQGKQPDADAISKKAGADTHAGETRKECHWLKMEQHDFPERGDQKSVSYENFTDVSEVKRYAEDHGFVGFALHEDVAYLKGGDNAPRSWKDLLWMGDTFKVDFYFCQELEVVQAASEQVENAQHVLDGYVSESTASVKGQWVGVHAVPKNEGTGMGFNFQREATSVDDMMALCGAHPDCVGFAYNPADQTFFAKQKNTGFVEETAQYYQKDVPIWRLASPGVSCEESCTNVSMDCATEVPMTRRADVADTIGMNSVMQKFDQECTSFDARFGDHSDVPNWNPQNGVCTMAAPDRATYSCTALPSPARKRRLCLCSQGAWQWFYIKSRAGNSDVEEGAPPHSHDVSVLVKKK